MFIILLDLQHILKFFLQKKKQIFNEMCHTVIKPRHPDGLKKTQIWLEKISNGNAAHSYFIGLHKTVHLIFPNPRMDAWIF